MQRIISSLVFLTFLFPAVGQHYSDVFFSNMTFAYDMDTVPHEVFRKVLSKNKKYFNQPLFTYGSDNPKDWELVRDAYKDYPEIVLPRVNQLDLNGDGSDDVVLSFLAGSEYLFTGFYLKQEKGYKMIARRSGVFYGKNADGMLCVRMPACCDDPTNEYLFFNLKNDEVVWRDSLSISVSTRQFNDRKELFQNKYWLATMDTITAVRVHGNPGIIGAWPPGTEIRVIKTQEDGRRFCEVRGRMLANRKWDCLPHSFVWLEDLD